jgi:hypothetical protein
MLARFTLAAAAVFACAGLAAAEPPAPAVVVQVKPVSRILSDIKEIIRQVGGPMVGNDLVKEFESSLKRSFGEKGFEGFDINRPFALYGVLAEKPEDITFVLVLPVSGEKEFVALLDRMRVITEPVKDKKGLYTLELQGDLLPKASHLRITEDGWAYITLNDGDATDAKNLVPVADLLKNAGTELVSAKLYPGRVPPKLLAGLLDQLDQAANGIKGLFVGGDDPNAKFMATFLEQGPKLLRRYSETALKEVTEVGLTFGFDATTGETVTEFTIVPKAGTPTAKEFAAFGATTNRFAGLVPKDAVAGLTGNNPLFAPELREITVAQVESARATLKEAGLPEKFEPVVEELLKGLTRAIKAGTYDVAFALAGPDKAGKYSVLGGLSVDDPSGVEKALREAAKDTTLAKAFQFDAAKAGDVSIHKVLLMKLLPEEASGPIGKFFGDDAPLYLAFAKDAVFVGFGTGSLDGLKAAVAAKPGPAPALDLTWNSGRIVKFAAAIDERAGAEVAKHLGTDDKAVSAMRLTAEGGQTLKVKFTFNVRYLPKLIMALVVKGRAGGDAPPPLPVAVPAKN